MFEFVINKTIQVNTWFREAVDGQSAGIRYELLYPSQYTVPFMTGILNGDNRQDINWRSPDGFVVKGQLQTTINEEKIILLGNLFYGFNANTALQQHFDGTIAIFSLHGEPVPPKPDPPIEENDDNKDLAPMMEIDAPLFPYIDVQPWPQNTLSNEPDLFQYDATGSPATSLYNQLLPESAKKDRTAIDQLVIAFLQNDPPFTGQYYMTLQQAPAPLNTFPAIYSLLYSHDTFEDGWVALQEQVGTASHWLALEDQVWQNYFALVIIAGYQDELMIAVNKILLVIRLIKAWLLPPAITPLNPQSAIHEWLQASIVLPAAMFPLPAEVPFVVSVQQSGKQLPVNSSYVKPYAIGQLKMTRYRLLGYRQGEIARIQNVLKGEKKKVTHRALTQSGEHTMRHTHNDRDNNNLSAESTHELLTEVKRTVAQLTKEIKYNDFTVSYGTPAEAKYTGGWSDTTTPGVPFKKNDINNFASLVLNRTLSRIREAVLESRAYSRFTESEEIQCSIFDNQQGSGHFRGIYRWVNKVYRISLENYGYRLMLKAYVANPAQAFIASQQVLNNTSLQKPVSPADNKIYSFTDISTDTYAAWLAYYGINEAPLPPEPSVVVTITLNQGQTEKYLTVPDGYIAVSGGVKAQAAAGATLTEVKGILGTTPFVADIKSTDDKDKTIALNHETGAVAIAVAGENIAADAPVVSNNFVLNASITCTVTDNKLNAWKMIIYREIMTAWQKMMQQYLSALTRYAGSDQQTNPLLLTNIAQSALTADCMDLLLGPAMVNDGNNYDAHRIRQFLQHSIEWHEMTWSYDDQPSLSTYPLQGINDSLRPFLQASSATVYLPVQPAFNFSLLYYLSAGVWWTPPYPFVPVNAGDQQTAAHLKSIAGWYGQRKEEKNWQLILPTDMQVIQESSSLPDLLTI